MATSGYSDAYVSKWDTLRFSWQQTGQSIENNYTDISWNIQLISGDYGSISSSAAKSWNVTVNGSYYEGTTTVGIGNNTTKTLASGTTRIYHNSDGSKQFSYSFNQYFGITFSGSKINTVSGTGTAWLEPIPRQAKITSAPDFTDEQNPTIYYSNPAGSAVKVEACISLTGEHDDVVYREVNPTSGQYTFNMNEFINRDSKTGHEILRAATTGKQYRFVKFYLRTTIGSTMYWDSKQQTYTVVNCAPTLNPTVVDQGSVSTTLTGSSNKMIRGYNVLQATFNASPKKGATIVSKSVTCGNKTLYNDGTFEYVYDNVFTFKATDNRGITVTKTVTLTAIDYMKPSCNNYISTGLSPDGSANITILTKGTCFNGSFGAEDNSIKVEYRYRANYGEYSDWIPISPALGSANDYEASVTINNLNPDYTYGIQTRIGDKTGFTDQSVEEVVKITPVFDWGKDDMSINVPLNIKEGITICAESSRSMYDSQDDNDETAFESWLNGQLQDMPDRSTKHVRVRSYPAVYKYQFSATIFKANSNYAVIEGFTYNNVKLHKHKQNGIWSKSDIGPKVLWPESGTAMWHMNGEQTITLSEPISAQHTGIVLGFSFYNNDNGTTDNSQITEFFVSKNSVSLFSGSGHVFNLCSVWRSGSKYLYITDTTIKGHAYNSQNISVGGIDYMNGYFVLRYVLGV